MEIKRTPPQQPSKEPESKKETHPSIPALMEQLAHLFRDIIHEVKDKDE